MMKEKKIPDYTKIGGWLYLVLYGLVGSAIRTCLSLASDFLPMFSNGTWAGIADPSIAVLIIVEILVNVALVAFAVLLLVQMWKKSPAFPKNAVFYFIAISAFPIIDALVASILVPNNVLTAGQIGALFGGAFSAVGWVWYMAVSIRVRETFRQHVTLKTESPVELTTSTVT